MERAALRHELHSNLKITVVELFDSLRVYALAFLPLAFPFESILFKFCFPFFCVCSCVFVCECLLVLPAFRGLKTHFTSKVRRIWKWGHFSGPGFEGWDLVLRFRAWIGFELKGEGNASFGFFALPHAHSGVNVIVTHDHGGWWSDSWL